MLKWFAILTSLILVIFNGNCQTHNDHMVNAEKLTLNQFVNSETHGNTVETKCVDEKLTGKCIDYHNDQWYTFTTDSLTHLYINISGQKCRDLRGVQLVVLEGELCNPTTYSILDCISTATQDDIYVELTNLKPNHPYWLNVDGYLRDFCSFFIEVSDTPKGFSSEQIPLPEADKQVRENIISMTWTVPDSLGHQLKQTAISTRDEKAFKFENLTAIPVAFNAFGEMQTTYQFSDTLMFPGIYHYRLALELMNGKKILAEEFTFRVSTPYQSKSANVEVLELVYDRKTPLHLEFISPGGELLNDAKFRYDAKQHSRFPFFTTKYRAMGLKGVEVKVTDTYRGHSQSHFVYFD